MSSSVREERHDRTAVYTIVSKSVITAASEEMKNNGQFDGCRDAYSNIL
jgi:hypothetical protein